MRRSNEVDDSLPGVPGQWPEETRLLAADIRDWIIEGRSELARSPRPVALAWLMHWSPKLIAADLRDAWPAFELALFPADRPRPASESAKLRRHVTMTVLRLRDRLLAEAAASGAEDPRVSDFPRSDEGTEAVIALLRRIGVPPRSEHYAKARAHNAKLELRRLARRALARRRRRGKL